MYAVLPPEHFMPEDPVRGDVPLAYTPSVPLRLISEAALYLGAKPGAKLRVDPYYEAFIAGAAGESLLQNIVRQTHQRAHPADTPRFEPMAGESETCDLAEPRFLQAIRHPEHLPSAEQSVRIVSDETGDALLIQKNVGHRIMGVSLGLSLRELTIGNTTWPAGMLLQVRTSHRMPPGEAVATIAPQHVSRLGVLRASAFALPVRERAVFLEGGVYDRLVTRTVGNISMHEIRERVSALRGARPQENQPTRTYPAALLRPGYN